MKLVSRSQVSDYVRLEGLQKLTNVSAHEWDLYILKELVDNALDADEAAGITPRVSVEMRYDGLGLTVIVRNQAQFPMDVVGDIFNLEKRASVKDLYNLPTRGAQGNALKTLLGIPYALQYHWFTNYSLEMRPLIIASGASVVDLWLDVNEFAQNVSLRPIQIQNSRTTIKGTEVSLNILKFTQERPRTPEALLLMARAFTLWNPHANFEFVFVLGDAIHSHWSRSEHGWTGKYDLRQAAPITWYTYGNFRELLHALLWHTQTHAESATTLGEVASLFGLPGLPASAPFADNASLGSLLTGDQLDPAQTLALYKALKDCARDQSAPSLGELGSAIFEKACSLPEDQADLFFYRRHATPTDQQIPFVLEVALGASTEGRRVVMTGINHTPTYRDPFLNKPLMPPGGAEPQRGLEKLLDYYGLRDDASVTLMTHLISPGVVYENYGKSAINDEPYREILTELVAEIVQEYIEATRPPEPVDYLSDPAQEYLPAVIRALKGTVFSEHQLISALKRYLHQHGGEDVVEDLTSQSADGRLQAVIREYQQGKPIQGLFRKLTGRLTVPRHPTEAITVSFVGRHLAELLGQYQARAVIVTNRSELEDLLLGLEFPLRYDVAILRTEGNRDAATNALITGLAISAAGASVIDASVSTPIWVVRDATLDGELFAKGIRDLLRKNRLAERSMVDIGLRVHDSVLDDAWIDLAFEPPPIQPNALRAAGLSAGDIAFYLEKRASVTLDSLAPDTLITWFERRLGENGAPLKSVPGAESLGAIAVERLTERFQRLVERIAFERYGLDSALAEVIRVWHIEFQDWDKELHARIAAALTENAKQSWKTILDRIVDKMLQDHLTAQRVDEIRERIGSQP